MAKNKYKGVGATTSIRFNKQQLKDFKDKCDLLDVDWQEMIRKMMTAFIEDRITIEVSEQQMNAMKGLHNVD